MVKRIFFANEEDEHLLNGIIENSISIAQLSKSVWFKIFRDSYDIYHIAIFTITNTTDQTEKIYKDIRLWKKDLRKVKK